MILRTHLLSPVLQMLCMKYIKICMTALKYPYFSRRAFNELEKSQEISFSYAEAVSYGQQVSLLPV